MMLDNICPGNGIEQDGVGALSSSPASASAYSIFNDLTYSDDDEADDYWDSAELGVSGSISSPETAALLDQIQNAMFPVQQTTAAASQQQQQQSHLMHPLARQKSAQSSEGDERSYLAYSVTSTVGDEDSSPRQHSVSSTAVTTSNYGSVDNNGPQAFHFKPKTTAAVTFRPPSSVFDHSSRSSSKQPKPSLPSAQQQHQRSPQTSPKRTNLKPKPNHLDLEKFHPNQFSKLQSTSDSRQQQQQSSTSGKQQPTNLGNCYPQPSTPFPSISDESPVTSATAATCSPGERDPEEDGYEEQPEEKERITRLLSEEATKRLRRHRRLKRIKKAAEARDAAVTQVRGVEQTGRCNDAIFAFIFLCQFLLVSMSAMAFGPGALRDKIYGELIHHDEDGQGDEGEESMAVDYNPFAGLQTDDIVIIDNPFNVIGGSTSGIHKQNLEDMVVDGISHIDYINVIQLLCIVSGYASLCSLLALGFMMMLSKNMLHVTLIFTIGVTLAWTILGLVYSSSWAISISGAVALVSSFSYTVVVWDRISFAATNLSVALKGMRSTLDVPFLGLCVLGVTFLWTMWWTMSFIGTFDFLNDDEDLSNNWMSVVIVFFVFSYYWTFQVIKGISQTTVASIIGKWWDMSEDEPLPLCSSVLQGLLSRNIIGSFGSICLGSLIVEPCILLTRFSTFSRLAKPKLNNLKSPKFPSKQLPSKQASNAVESDGKCDLGGCIPNSSCSLRNDSVISRNVNQWSFTYIGLYGYKFWDSGSKASQLFEARGWTHVVSDDLIMTVMVMTSLIIGGSTACLALIVEEVDGYSFTSLNKPIATAFLIGLFVGFVLSSAFLSIIEGSVSAILVCYAASPVEFHANHHKLSNEMKSAWKHFWIQKPTR